MSKVLLPIDASELSQKAVEYATSLAATETSKLTLLHVLPPLPPGKTITFIDPAQYMRFQKEDAIEQLQPIVDQVEASNVAHEVHYEVGVTYEVISAYAEQNHDLIVMGTHGYGRVTGWMMGSVGYPLLPHLPIPAILVPKEATVTSAPKRIMIAVDGSEYAKAAAIAAIELGKKTGAEFLLFTAVGYSQPYAIALHQTLHEGMVKKGEEIVAGYEDLLKSHGVAYTKRVAIGDPSICIKEVAEESGCDLIAMGYHGANNVSDFLLGSVVYKVIHRTTTPLLIVKS